MADSPKPSATIQYVVSALILFLLAALFIIAILYLRPALDPLLLITTVVGVFITIFTSVASFLKSQETHLTVNSQLSAWKAESTKTAHAEGYIQGGIVEQERMAEVNRLRTQPGMERRAPPPVAAAAPAPIVRPDATGPVSVIVQNVDPVPVKDVGAGNTGDA
jgi:hypothetical protein